MRIYENPLKRKNRKKRVNEALKERVHYLLPGVSEKDPRFKKELKLQKKLANTRYRDMKSLHR